MTASHLITNRNLTFLCNVNTNRLVNCWRQLVTILPCKYLCIHNNTVSAVWNTKGSITNFSCLFTENSTKKSFFSSKFCLSLRSHLTYQNISGMNFCTDTDDTILIQIF